VQRLEIKILPYILFLVIPVLGRMTDNSNDVRLVATNIFATLVKLIPLEVSDMSPYTLVAVLTDHIVTGGDPRS
jgi:TATA-binding protein-associated factor